MLRTRQKMSKYDCNMNTNEIDYVNQIKIQLCWTNVRRGPSALSYLLPLLSTSSQERTGPQVTSGPARLLNLSR